MLSTVLCVICAAVWGDGPLRNQPGPQVARPVPGAVVPVGYVEELQISAFIPPAPLPEFDDVESPEIQFEFSRPALNLFPKSDRCSGWQLVKPPESCSDSHVCPPAPPAELETAAPSQQKSTHVQINRQWVGSAEAQVIACDEEPEPAVSVDGPQSISQLHHLQIAIQHLEAAGMKSAAQPLRERHEQALSALRQEIERQLVAKQTELLRVTGEIERLRSVLAGDATLARLTPLADDDLSVSRDRGFDSEPLLIITPLSNSLFPIVPEPEPITPMSAEELKVWRRAIRLPESLDAQAPSESTEVLPPHPVELQFHLIPSPATNGRPQLVFPKSPRPLRKNRLEPLDELPPSPMPPEDAEEEIQQTSEAERGPVT